MKIIQLRCGVRLCMLASVAVLAATSLTTSVAQQASAPAPAPTKGPTGRPLVQMDLTNEIDSVKGRALKMQITTYAPGASNKPHTHKDRPETVYMLSGKIIEHRGSIAKEYGPGDSFTAGKDTEHWIENTGTVPAVLLVTGIQKQ